MRMFEPKALGTMAPATKLVVYGILGLWTLIVLFPLYWVLITSFKLPIHVFDGPNYLPFIDFLPSLHAWRYIFLDLGRDTFRPYGNSLIVAATSTALAVTAGTLAAYALSRIEFRPRLLSIGVFLLVMSAAIFAVAHSGADWRIAAASGVALFVLAARATRRLPSPQLGNAEILFWMISQRILPPVVAVVPIYVMLQQVGLLDTRSALVLTYTTVNLPIVVWLMYDFFISIPRELEESAAIDGASRFRIFREIVLPLAKPGLVATALLVFILAWNEYLLALFLSTVKAQTIPLLVAAQNATRGPQWWYMSVLITIMILPVIVLTIVLQRFIAKGLLLGALKG
ncbi:carbohydrate ABC transporter permease [Ensifer sp. IC3342]|nr:carbohydrate ABC transporter permease [Ensifer sp. BRP08]MCA1448028.1 carbohydrate ABC transporter permease [Ensifer sp. IC3342]